MSEGHDMRKWALKRGLRQLRAYEIRRLIDYVGGGMPVLLDRDEHGHANFSSGMFCPLAIAVSAWEYVSGATDQRVTKFLTEECGFEIYNTRGVPGNFYTTNRRADLLEAAREVLYEKLNP